MQTNRLKEHFSIFDLPTETEVLEYHEETKEELLHKVEQGERTLRQQIIRNPAIAVGIGLVAGLAIGWWWKR